MFLRIKEQFLEIMASSQLWIALVGGFFSLTFIGVFFDLGFIKLHVAEPELKHLIVTEFIIILFCATAMIIPGLVAQELYKNKILNLPFQNKTKDSKKKLLLKTAKQQIEFRKATNTVLLPFIVFFNPFSMQQLFNAQYLLLGLTVLVMLVLWMVLDFILYAKFYLKYFKINNIRNKIWYVIKKNIITDIIILRAFILLINLFIFVLVAQKSVLLENNFSTYEDYLDVFTFELALLIPSTIFMYFTGIRSWIYSIITAIFICCLFLSHVKEIFIPWLSKNHFYDFDDYKFVFSKKACDDLKFSKVKIIKSSSQTCKIATNYKVLSAAVIPPFLSVVKSRGLSN